MCADGWYVEVYSFLRSPYRDLALYDAIVQVSDLSESGWGDADVLVVV